MTRNGKIARLPNSIRAELNQRLLNGEQGKKLVEWLNSLPAVQALMKEAFEGRPILEENLSAWKNGGYLSWASGERMWETVSSFMEGTAGLKSAGKSGLMDRMALLLAAAMVGQITQLESMPESSEKAKIWRELRIGLLALRRSELYAQRLKIENRKHGRRKRPVKSSPEVIAERQRRIMNIMGVNEGYDGTKNPELTRRPTPENQGELDLMKPNEGESKA